VRKIIKNMLAVVFVLTAGTAVAYAYSSYNECRCNQASLGSVTAYTCCVGGWGGYGGSGDSRCCSSVGSTYVWDSANKKCCGWAQSTASSAQKYCTPTSGSTKCTMEYNNTTQPTCNYANRNITWTNYTGGTCVNQGTLGYCYSDKGNNSGSVYTSVTAIPYTCLCQ